jgi:hypothetical protein
MQINNRQQLLTILTLSVIGLLVLDSVVTPPLTKLWHDRQAKIAMLKNEVKEGTMQQRRKDSLRSRWAQIQAGALTNDTTGAEQQLLVGLNRWSQYSDISINGTAQTWKPGSDTGFRTLECRVDVSGSIDRLSRFLYELETDPMALKVQSIEMTSKDNTGSVINLGVQISGLVLTQQEPKK